MADFVVSNYPAVQWLRHASLHKQSLTFDRLLEPMDSASHTRLWREETPKAVAEVREAVSKIDAFLKAVSTIPRPQSVPAAPPPRRWPARRRATLTESPRSPL